MKLGMFISVEGTDGSGKSTQLKKIHQYLIEKGYDVCLIREPGGTSIGEQIRNILLDSSNKNMSAICEMMLYAASRSQLINEVIKPALEKGKVIICDRFVDSSLVYQGGARNLGTKTVWEINSHAIGEFMPDITFFFDLHPDIAFERMNHSNRELDRLELENKEFHLSVYNNYLELANEYPERISRIDSNGTEDEIFANVLEVLERELNKRMRYCK